MKHDQSQELCLLLFTIKDRLDTLFSAVAQSCQVTPMQMVILLYLKRDTSSSLKELRNKLNLNQGNTSTLCKNMEQNGLLRRVRDEKDERIVRLSLTSTGLNVASRLEHCLQQLSQALESCPAAQVEPIYHGMQQTAQILAHLSSVVQQPN